MTRDDVSLLLDAYDAQLRAHVHDRLPDSVRVERDGPLVRTVGFGNRGFVEYRELAGLDGERLDRRGACGRPGRSPHLRRRGRRSHRLRRLGAISIWHGVRDVLGRSDAAGLARDGIYRALVAHRAKLAAERGRRYIEVDASDDSRPILERLGFVAVTTTTPYVWSPSPAGRNR